MKNMLILILFLMKYHLSFSAEKTLDFDSVQFLVYTNISAIKVAGEAKGINVKLDSDDLNKKINNIKVIIPIESLTTHMSIRDSHMREKIFTDKNGNIPPLIFESETPCLLDKQAGECSLSGKLSIRGEPQEIVIPLNYIKKGDLYEISFEYTTKLSDYKIERPSQLGVKVKDEVKISGKSLMSL